MRVQGDPSQLLDAARRALHEQGVVRFGQDDPELGLLEGTTGMSMQSFGTVVTVNIGAIDNGFCKVHIRTTPRLATTMADYGTAASLVDALDDALVDASQVPLTQATTESTPASRRQADTGQRTAE